MLLQVSGGAEAPQIEQRVSTGQAHANQRTSKSMHIHTAAAAMVMAMVTAEQQQWQLTAAAAAAMTMMTAGVAAVAGVAAMAMAARYKGSMARGSKKAQVCICKHQRQYKQAQVGARGVRGYT